MLKRLTWIAVMASCCRRRLVAADDDRAADRAAIRAHIDRIFQAFIHKDSAELRATHAANWLGYLEGSRTMIRGVDGYMDWSGLFRAQQPVRHEELQDARVRHDLPGRRGVRGVRRRRGSQHARRGLFQRTLRITDFYTKQAGGWIQTGSDTDLHPESLATQQQTNRTLYEGEKKRLLEAREAVWRAYFAGDRAALEKLLPEELLTLEPGGEWGNRKAVFEGSARFAAGGGKLVRLEFPKTEMQVYGPTAIVYSSYLYEIEQGGKRSVNTGRVTEVFVNRNGTWVNPSWHMDTGH